MKQKRVAICAEDKGNIRRCCVFQSLKALLKKREKFQATAEETRMMKHLQRRNELHEELHAEQLEAERFEREHTGCNRRSAGSLLVCDVIGINEKRPTCHDSGVQLSDSQRQGGRSYEDRRIRSETQP